MSKNTAPIYRIGQHCSDEKIHRYFKVTSFDVVSCTQAEFKEHHGHEYYEIIWLKQGKGIHLIDGVAYPYDGAVIYLLAPGQMHKLQQAEKTTGYILKFLPGIFSDARDSDEYLLDSCLFDNIDAAPMLKPAPEDISLFENLFSMMQLELQRDGMGQEKILPSYLKILFTHLMRLKPNQACIENRIFGIGHDMFRRYKVEIEKNYRTLHHVQDYADLLSTQARNLNILSRRFVGRSAGELITDRIMLEAKRYLHHQSLSMKEIAFSLGFDDPAYFNRFFKKHTGVAPGQYKLLEVRG
ncbi:MAG TPA: helix-turn-helix domain-containing protein [Chitinophaga sp.]|uniref:helix-turn-helix domain-containing protein n=1 Tax=Chitinophaga sp. TaxID=1869181 RepID=UPI002BC1B393|nr:helix-turn-helix domain-containing protein [Chitinophaga sp.]HVI48750.1 helix-turn-helix domain-containing protein [Chitinophaga sp.]